MYSTIPQAGEYELESENPTASRLLSNQAHQQHYPSLSSTPASVAAMASLFPSVHNANRSQTPASGGVNNFMTDMWSLPLLSPMARHLLHSGMVASPSAHFSTTLSGTQNQNTGPSSGSTAGTPANSVFPQLNYAGLLQQFPAPNQAAYFQQQMIMPQILAASNKSGSMPGCPSGINDLSGNYAGLATGSESQASSTSDSNATGNLTGGPPKTIMTDSDDEVRIVTEPKRPRTPNSGVKAGRKQLTTQQKQDIVRANERGVKKTDIAKIFDTSVDTVSKVLNQYRSEGTVKRRPGAGRPMKTTPEIEQFIVNASQNDSWNSAPGLQLDSDGNARCPVCDENIGSQPSQWSAHVEVERAKLIKAIESMKDEHFGTRMTDDGQQSSAAAHQTAHRKREQQLVRIRANQQKRLETQKIVTPSNGVAPKSTVKVEKSFCNGCQKQYDFLVVSFLMGDESRCFECFNQYRKQIGALPTMLNGADFNGRALRVNSTNK
ncbi:Paired box domain-containing protein [Ditylenchus destructor]|nr:Paired box domain-containing protein [Ditylenchus destructor]